jgi:hypothetical protein
MIDKILQSPAAALADVPDGATAYGVPARRVSGARGRRA